MIFSQNYLYNRFVTKAVVQQLYFKI